MRTYSLTLVDAEKLAAVLLAHAGPFADYIDTAIASGNKMLPAEFILPGIFTPANRVNIAARRLALLKLHPNRLRELSGEELVGKIVAAVAHHCEQRRARALNEKTKDRQRKRERQGVRTRGGRCGSKYSCHALCLECRRVNAHGSGCTRNAELVIALPIKARPPRHDASQARWKQFFRACGTWFGGRDIRATLVTQGLIS